MALTKKAIILFDPELHRRITSLAKKQHASFGELVRAACRREYCEPTREERIAAARRLGAMNLPVSDVATMKRESIADPKPLS